jgi:putative spermidine/putrescine transport system substrate-binding protein
MMVTRRDLLVMGLAASAAPALPRGASAQPRPTLRVQCIGGLVEKTIRESVIPDFEREHGTDIQLIVEDDVTILPKLQIARGRAPYDVCMMDNDKAILGAEMGVWAPDQSAKLKNIGAIYESCKPPATANYGTMIYEYALVYNTEKLKTPPASWQDLWTPGLVAAVPHVSQAYGLTFLYIAAILNGGSATDLEPGFAAIKRLGKFRIYKSVSEGLALFQQKEADAGLFYGHRGQQMIDAGFPIAKTVPKEGTWGQRTGVQIPKGTANLDGAVAWVDTMLSAPVQAAFAKSLYSPTNRDTTVPPDLEKRLVFGAQHVNAIREAPWKDILPQRDVILDRWTKEFGT